MRIDRLTVDHFKGFEHREFSFHPQVNLLVGENGTGKTSVLDALSVAMGGWLLGIRGYDTRHIRNHEVQLKPMPQVVGESARSGPISWENAYPCSVETSGEVMGQHLTWRRALNDTRSKTTYVDARNIKKLATGADHAVRSGDHVVLPLISYYGTGRLYDVPRNEYKIGSGKDLRRKAALSRLSGYDKSVDPRMSVEGLTRWIAEQSWIAFQQGRPTSTWSAVSHAILACIEGATDIYFDAQRGEVIVALGEQCIQPFVNLSDGQRSLLAMVGDIARKAATLNPALGEAVLAETPGVVLIDELDLHLHPVWQRRVIEDLRTVFPKIQFFATTHSPFLIQSLRSGEELVMLHGSPAAHLGNQNLEAIADGIMGVVNPAVSRRYAEMNDVARNYLQDLQEASPAGNPALRERLSAAIAPYADNPAYQAFLELKRAVRLGD
jgi:predicted ATP-binding protein involved in virulence